MIGPMAKFCRVDLILAGALCVRKLGCVDHPEHLAVQVAGAVAEVGDSLTLGPCRAQVVP